MVVGDMREMLKEQQYVMENQWWTVSEGFPVIITILRLCYAIKMQQKQQETVMEQRLFIAETLQLR